MRYEEILGIFPRALREAIDGMRLDTARLQEIRVRAGRPLVVLCGGRESLSDQSVSVRQLGELPSCLGNYSLYAYEEEIRRGYLSLPGGHRVGIAGRTVLAEGQIRTITEVSSLNLRFAHEIPGCADALLPRLWEKDRLLSTLVVSAPGRGKTTILRDCIRQISNGAFGHAGMTVGVVDERSEIAGSFRGVPGNDVGLRTDVLDGCPKSQGMLMLIRSMAPQVVAVDEIGGQEDIQALGRALHCGCVLFATVHGSGWEELAEKAAFRDMLEQRMFERYVLLDSSGPPGQVAKILNESGAALDGEGSFGWQLC